MAINGVGAGFFTNLTALQIDLDLGGDALAIMQALDRAHRRYQSYWLPMGTDPVNGYAALKVAAGESTQDAATDYGNASTAAALMEKLYQICQGNGTIAVDSGNAGNGTVTIGATGSGFNFATFLGRVIGDAA